MKKFIEYVKSFYSVGGIYDYKFTHEEIVNAIFVRLEMTEAPEFLGDDCDSIDREMVRDIVLLSRGEVAV